MDIITATPLIYHNMLFIFFALTEADQLRIDCLCELWNKGMYLRDISKWCKTHKIFYLCKFYWRKDYPVTANIWNWLTVTLWTLLLCIRDLSEKY